MSKSEPVGHADAQADAVGDVDVEYDVMQWERRSLQRRKARGKPDMPFELEDPELQDNIAKAWEKDRQKKAEKKKEREELRLVGLLGDNKSRRMANLPYKRPELIPMEKIIDEIRAFLISSDEVLELPPLPKPVRYTVHEIANNFGLRSISKGEDPARYATLVKQNKTIAYDKDKNESLFWLRKWSTTEDSAKKPVLRGFARKNSSRAVQSSSAANWRDGDVVGASARIIGDENKGRNMLEKLGWKTGEGLGAENNKGILEPVSHIVKTTKAGLS